jgi:hypothetical protein
LYPSILLVTAQISESKEALESCIVALGRNFRQISQNPRQKAASSDRRRK